MLPREEYIEQAYFFRVLGERLPTNAPLQDVLAQVREEVLATTKLPMAIDFLLAELKHAGVLATATRKLAHYFSPFQTYLLEEAENDRGRFDMRVAVQVLRREAEYRAGKPTEPGLFLYQFETLCRNRLRYDPGLLAISEDPFFDDRWRPWILTVRRQMGIVDFADLLYVRSEYYRARQDRLGREIDADKPILFEEKEGKIAWANRRKDPLYLFAALQRQLGYPEVPRLDPIDDTAVLLPQILRRLEQMDTRIKLLEQDQRGGFDLTKFYQQPPEPPAPLA